MKQDMPTTGEPTSSTTEGPHDDEVAKLIQAFVHALDLEGITKVNRRLKFLKVFIRLSPPEYAGNPDDPLEAVEWLRRIKKCLNVIDVPEDLRVGFAAYTLTGAAGYWWDFVERSHDVESMTWEVFEPLFLNKYFPEHTRDAKFREFIKLTQGNMTVAQYEAKFLQLSWHAPNYVSSDGKIAEKFLMGLTPSIRRDVSFLRHKTYNEVVAAALRVEKAKDECQSVRATII